MNVSPADPLLTTICPLIMWCLPAGHPRDKPCKINNICCYLHILKVVVARLSSHQLKGVIWKLGGFFLFFFFFWGRQWLSRYISNRDRRGLHQWKFLCTVWVISHLIPWFCDKEQNTWNAKKEKKTITDSNRVPYRNTMFSPCRAQDANQAVHF